MDFPTSHIVGPHSLVCRQSFRSESDIYLVATMNDG